MALNYKEFIDNAIAELSDLKEQRSHLELEKAQVEAKIAALVSTVEALAQVVDQDGNQRLTAFLRELGDASTSMGITDRIRLILRQNVNQSGHQVALTVPAIRDKLQASGWDLSKYANALSTIHTISKRLVKGGEATEITLAGERAFCWAKK
jgi:hypothetical protein